MNKKTFKIVMCGYYGHGNFGDEAILSVILDKIKSASPSINAKIFILKGKNLAKVIKTLRKADVFIFGGGSLLQNSTSTASLLYYLSTIRLAAHLCKRKIMLANGIGPVRKCSIPRKILLPFVAESINKFDFISVRDRNSQLLLQKLLPRRNIHLCPDPTLTIFAENNEKINYGLTMESERTPIAPFFVFIPCARGLKKAGIDPRRIASSMRSIKSKFGLSCARIVVLNENEDLKIAREIAKEVGISKIFVPKTPQELCNAIEGAKFVISQRYHGALFSIACGRATLGVSGDPKMSGLCRDFGAFSALSPAILARQSALHKNISFALSHQENNGEKTKNNVKNSARRSENLLGALFLHLFA